MEIRLVLTALCTSIYSTVDSPSRITFLCNTISVLTHIGCFWPPPPLILSFSGLSIRPIPVTVPPPRSGLLQHSNFSRSLVVFGLVIPVFLCVILDLYGTFFTLVWFVSSILFESLFLHY